MMGPAKCARRRAEKVCRSFEQSMCRRDPSLECAKTPAAAAISSKRQVRRKGKVDSSGQRAFKRTSGGARRARKGSHGRRSSRAASSGSLRGGSRCSEARAREIEECAWIVEQRRARMYKRSRCDGGGRAGRGAGKGVGGKQPGGLEVG